MQSRTTFLTFAALVYGTVFSLGQTSPMREASSSVRAANKLIVTPAAPTVTQQGTVVGRNVIWYELAGRKGQKLSVTLQSASFSVYFNVMPSDSLEAIYASDREATGNSGVVTLPADGTWRIQVYLFRNAARRAAKASFRLSVSLQ